MSSVLFSYKNYCGIDVEIDKTTFFIKITKNDLAFIPEKAKRKEFLKEIKGEVFVHPHLWTLIQAKTNYINFFKVMEYLEPSVQVEQDPSTDAECESDTGTDAECESNTDADADTASESQSKGSSQRSFGAHSSGCECTICDFDRVYKRVKRKLEDHKSCNCIEYTLEDLQEILSRIKTSIVNIGLPEFTDSVNTDSDSVRDSACDCHLDISRTIKLIFACLDHIKNNFVYLRLSKSRS